jgi:hypothetical protein
MAEPIERAPGIERSVERLAKLLYGKSLIETIKKDECIHCGKPATEFRDDTSRKEYTITGYCQECQDKFFDDPELREVQGKY